MWRRVRRLGVRVLAIVGAIALFMMAFGGGAWWHSTKRGGVIMAPSGTTKPAVSPPAPATSTSVTIPVAETTASPAAPPLVHQIEVRIVPDTIKIIVVSPAPAPTPSALQKWTAEQNRVIAQR